MHLVLSISMYLRKSFNSDSTSLLILSDCHWQLKSLGCAVCISVVNLYSLTHLIWTMWIYFCNTNTVEPENGFRRRHHGVVHPEVLQLLHQPPWASSAVRPLSWLCKPAGAVQTQYRGMYSTDTLTVSFIVCVGALLMWKFYTDTLVLYLFPYSCWKQQRGFTQRIATFSWTRRRNRWSWVTSVLGLNWRRLLQTAHET